MTRSQKALMLEQLAIINDAADALKHSNYIRAKEIKIAVTSLIEEISVHSVEKEE